MEELEENFEDGWIHKIIGTFHDKKRKVKIRTIENHEEIEEENMGEENVSKK